MRLDQNSFWEIQFALTCNAKSDSGSNITREREGINSTEYIFFKAEAQQGLVETFLVDPPPQGVSFKNAPTIPLKGAPTQLALFSRKFTDLQTI